MHYILSTVSIKVSLVKRIVLSSEWVVKIRTRVLQAIKSKHAGTLAEQYTKAYSVLKCCFIITYVVYSARVEPTE